MLGKYPSAVPMKHSVFVHSYTIYHFPTSSYYITDIKSNSYSGDIHTVGVQLVVAIFVFQ